MSQIDSELFQPDRPVRGVSPRNALITLQNERFMRWKGWMVQKNPHGPFHRLEAYTRGRDAMNDVYIRAVVPGGSFLLTEDSTVYPIGADGKPVSWEQAAGQRK